MLQEILLPLIVPWTYWHFKGKKGEKTNRLTSTLSLSYVFSFCNVAVWARNFLEAFHDGEIPNNTQTASMTILTSWGGFARDFISVKSPFDIYKVNVSKVNLDLQNKGIWYTVHTKI
jgi:hypothetical protein